MTAPPLSPQLAALASRLLDGRLDQADLLSAATVAVIRHRDRISAAENPGGLSYVVGRAAMLKYRQRQHRHARVGVLATDPQGREPDPADAAERQDLINAVRQAVGALPPAQRRLVELRHLGENRVSVRQAAKALGVTVDWVRHVEGKALAALAAVLADG